MRFVWITRENPLNPDRGDLLYSGGLLKSLLESDMKGDLIAYRPHGARPESDRANLKVTLLDQPKRIRALSLATNLPSDAYRLRSAAMSDAIRAALQGNCDIVFLDYYAMAWCLPLIEEARRNRNGSGPALVYVAHHYEQELRPRVAREFQGSVLTKAVLPLDAEKAARLERRILAVADAVTTITEEDRQAFVADVPNMPVLTLLPGYSGPVDAGHPITADLPRRVTVVGAFDWIAKRQNLRRFVQAADAPFRAAGVELSIVGRAEPGFIEEIKAISPICTFTGRVADVYPYLRQTRIGLMPDELGGGFKLKFLDYIFNGIPVASVRAQTVGLPLDLDEDLIARDDLVGLAHAIVEAIDDIPRLDGMRQRAFDKCRDSFRWETRGRDLRALAEQAIARRRAG